MKSLLGWLALMAFLWSASAAASTLFTVVSSKGSIFRWSPFATGWKAVKTGEVIDEGTLVQVGSNGRLKLSSVDQVTDGKPRGKQLTVDVSRPMIFRLSSGVLRQVSLTSYFVKRLSDRPGAKALGDPGLLHLMDEAWQRVAAMIVPEHASASAQKAGDHGTALSNHAARIHVSLSQTKIKVESEHLPASVQALWRSDRPTQTSYEVYVWHASDPRPAPYAVTKSMEYKIWLASAGDYFVQVVAEDGSAMSSPQNVRVFVDRPKGEGLAVSGGLVRRVELVRLAFPPAHYVDATSSFAPWPRQQLFSWQAVAKGETVPEYKLRVETAAGDLVGEQSTAATSASVLLLKPGRYRWSVSLSSTQKVGALAPYRSFEIAAEPLAAALSAALGKKGSTYLWTGEPPDGG